MKTESLGKGGWFCQWLALKSVIYFRRWAWLQWQSLPPGFPRCVLRSNLSAEGSVRAFPETVTPTLRVPNGEMACVEFISMTSAFLMTGWKLTVTAQPMKANKRVLRDTRSNLVFSSTSNRNVCTNRAQLSDVKEVASLVFLSTWSAYAWFRERVFGDVRVLVYLDVRVCTTQKCQTIVSSDQSVDWTCYLEWRQGGTGVGV